MKTTIFATALVTLTSVASLGIVATGAGAAGSAASTRPVMSASATTIATLAPCKDLPALPTARCGVLKLPLDRSRPEKGSTAVAFALVPRTDLSKPGLGTIVPNPGGPGASVIDLSGELFGQAFAALGDRRDLLLIDPRGVGRSGPITCPALATADRLFSGLQRQRQLIGECGRQLGKRVGDYGTAAFADDIDAVRARLGVDQLDLVGVSYSTYLMPVYAHRHPKHVRTVTLAGAYAVNIDAVGKNDVAAFRRAVKLVCERTQKCSGDKVLADLGVLAARLRKHPDRVDVTYEGVTHRVVLDEWRMTSTAASVYQSQPDTETQLALASAAAAGRHGNLEPFRALVREGLTATAGNLSLGSALYSDTLAWAATCHDYPRAFDYDDRQRTRLRDYERAQSHWKTADFFPFNPKAWVTRADYDTGACLAWPNDPTATSPLPKGARLPDVPVLVLSGDLDANTSSASGRQAAAQFPHATFKEIKNAGHTPASTPEGVGEILAFIAAGRA
ncbi:alpha/beta hydrolase [Kribbella sp. CA-293567]|uniref:alpha/beta hydrolase n=1 Tax=Kribbella sp. CA-293567 TaxID=3002436 RepID=UPI0022DE4FCE|nr:alpha/beta fold hydrolase [Kribbella sp. CA-293567]WBQ04389.1 alpha/beta fold hydrolase [Kribbella sp. CA-293567]